MDDDRLTIADYEHLLTRGIMDTSAIPQGPNNAARTLPIEAWGPTNGLKFIKMKDGRHILHQHWFSTWGNVEWRPVPMETEA